MDVRTEKPEQSSSYFKHIFKIALTGLFILSSLFFLNQIKLSQYFPIKKVLVYGVSHIDHQEIQELLTPYVHSGFFNTHVDHIKERLLQLPWVASVFVRRNWPDQIEVTVIEKNAIAHWNDESLLSAAGELFTPKKETYPAELPKFVGPEGRQIMMLQYFKKMNHLLMPLRIKISYLELTPYLTWKLKLDNGISLQVGHKDILTRIHHFVKVYPKIIGNRAADVDYIDLRYPNGLAVRFRVA